jgi:hypothetical protein
MITHPNPKGLTIEASRAANGLPANDQGDTLEYFLDRTTIITEADDPDDAPGLKQEISGNEPRLAERASVS